MPTEKTPFRFTNGAPVSNNGELTRGSQAAGYGLGVEMLSKKLVVRITIDRAHVHIPHDC